MKKKHLLKRIEELEEIIQQHDHEITYSSLISGFVLTNLRKMQEARARHCFLALSTFNLTHRRITHEPPTDLRGFRRDQAHSK